MQTMMSDIFEELKATKSSKKKIEILHKYDTPVFREFCAYVVNPNIQWMVPKGIPPYEKADPINMEEALYETVRRLYLFVKGGGNDNLTKIKREEIFINTLQTIHPKDAELLIKVKDKEKIGITEKVINDAWPGFLTY